MSVVWWHGCLVWWWAKCVMARGDAYQLCQVCNKTVIWWEGVSRMGGMEVWLHCVKVAWWHSVMLANCVKAVMKRSYLNKIWQVRRGIEIMVVDPMHGRNSNRYIMATCDGGQVASYVSWVVRVVRWKSMPGE